MLLRLAAVSLCAFRSQTDKIFSQQSALGKVHEEVQALREQLETRQAQQAVIEAEITRQVRQQTSRTGLGVCPMQ
jgi:hypothetical protein